ncbi:hypothetical protein CQY22_008190 [Mycolicibacterium brumae]|uniref:Uncharacterized protein n=2 Tax=Mycolicibacterium brumae TaxID=85968 RepID=A0A2G5PCB0_9MYCO|nr:hypothetical protein CQY22_008190 [Mycolicibacterium brumae]RWA16197.1 hypothetical protein MBRU_08805 [Mycolicibacterium brumae DSM 44177]
MATMWRDLPDASRATLWRLADRLGDFLPGELGAVPTHEQLLAASAWSTVECDVTVAYSAWLEREHAKYRRNGWPWTTAELARRSRLREVGE